MKRVLPVSNFTFQPTLNRVDFSLMGGGFKRENLYAVINITTGKLIYAVASVSAGFGGTFVGNVLTYSSSNAGQLASDVLQVIYDDETMVQNITGSVTIQDPATVQGNVGAAHTLPTAIHDGSGTYPILSTPDPLTLREGLDVHVQSSSVQGLLNNPLPLPYQNQALSVGYINGGDLVTPAMNIGTNELIVDATQSGNVPVSIDAVTTPITVDIGTSPTLNVNLQSSGITQPVSAVGTFPVSAASALPVSASGTFPVSAASLPLPSGAATAANQTSGNTSLSSIDTKLTGVATAANQTTGNTTLSTISGKLPAALGAQTTANSMAVNIASDQVVPTSLPDLNITGQASQSALINNIIPATAGASSTDANGYRSGYVQIVASAGISSGQIIFECSNDNVNFQVMPAFTQSLITGAPVNTAFNVTVNSQFIYGFPITARFIRVRISTTIVGGTVQAFTRLSQAAFTQIVQPVAQPTAANLNATVSGTVTVTQATPANLNVTAAVSGASIQSAQTTDITSAAITTTQTSVNVGQINIQACAFGVYVTAISGASAAMDVQVQETMDGTNYYTIYQFERITAVGQYYSPAIKLAGSGVRYVRTVSGTTPSITNSLIRISRSGQAETIRRFIDRTIVPNTLNSNTGSFFCDGVEDFNLIVRCTTQTTAATIALEFSMDGTNWFTSSATVTTAVGIVQAKIDNMQFKFVRANVTAAGTGITLGEITIGGHSA